MANCSIYKITNSINDKVYIGKTHSAETKQKLSDMRQGKDHPMYGKNHTDETKARMSKSRKGRVSPNKGNKLSEEQKQTLSLAKMGRSWKLINGKRVWSQMTTCNKEQI